ncbi:hypothetical protein MHYP_G00088730 [Metynnis hypsauchen]
MQHGWFVYTQDQLMALKLVGMATRTKNMPEELWRRMHRGRRAGMNQRTGKMDELTALARSQREYRECSLMCFSETWLHQDILDAPPSPLWVGGKKQTNKRPRPLGPEAEHYKHKELIVSKGRELRGTDFGINDQFPRGILDRR